MVLTPFCMLESPARAGRRRMAFLICLIAACLFLMSAAQAEPGESAYRVPAAGWLSGNEWYSLAENREAIAEETSPGSGPEGPGNVYKDWEGLKKDTFYFLSYQFIAIGLLYIAPTSVSNWTKEDKKNADFGKWWDNVSDPQWDSDVWWINYILHPYWGSSYYVRAQMRGYNPTESFWYSFVSSAMYEYGAEAIFEEPSIQDLIVTPGLGAVLGSVFMDIRYGIEEKRLERGKLTGWDKFVLVATDPLGALNNSVDRLFGREVQVYVVPYHSRRRPEDTGVGWRQGDRMDRPIDDTYGLQVKVVW